MVKIVVDPGHGAGRAFNRGGVLFNEGDQNFLSSVVFKEEMEKYIGASVTLTRKNIFDDPSLYKRATMVRGADLFLSWHTNAATSSVRGSEVYLSYKNNSLALARKLNDVSVRVHKTNNRGVRRAELVGNQARFHMATGKERGKTDYFGVLRNSTAKYSVLAEWVFHTNKKDSQNLLNNTRLFARELAKVIATHYGLKKKATTVTPTVEVKKMYSDVNKSYWAYEMIKTATDLGIMEGYEDGTFRPERAVTRAELAAVISRMADGKVSKPVGFKVGQRVKVKTTAKTFATGQNMASFVKGSSYTINQVDNSGKRALLNGINSWVRFSDLEV